MVLSTQRAAQASLEWFENLGQYVGQAPEQFAFNIMTRSRRVTHDNLKVRDPEFVAATDAWFAQSVPGGRTDAPPMFQPFRLGTLDLVNRVVVSPMDMYRSPGDGMPTEFHLVHLGGKALGGAGLVMTEMVCVSPEGRITPGCTGIWSDEQAAAWRRITEFVHDQSPAKIGCQIGHSGRKGSTKLMWEGVDEPLDEGNWAVVGPSPLSVPRRAATRSPASARPTTSPPSRSSSSPPRATRSPPASTSSSCTAPTATCCPRSSRRSPTSAPTSTAARSRTGCATPSRSSRRCERRVPDHVPLTVRISATDWAPGGITGEDAVESPRPSRMPGAAAIDVSSGQVTPDERPAFGRSYQTPFADAIRNRVDIPTIAVGIISSWDDVNSLVLAGRADLCAVGRAHLYDPNWTLHAAIEQDYDGPGAVWPDPWKAGRRKPQTGRTDGPKPRLQLVREGVRGTRHQRWRPHG